MTRDERDAIRTARDSATRERLLERNEYDARYRRLFDVCCMDSPIRRSNQVRSVMRMLEQAEKARALRAEQ